MILMPHSTQVFTHTLNLPSHILYTLIIFHLHSLHTQSLIILQNPPPVFQMTSFVQLAAFSVHINLSDGLVYTYPSEKFFTHLSARISFKLDLNVLIYNHITMALKTYVLFYCSLTGTASYWYDLDLKSKKETVFPFCKLSRNNPFVRKKHTMLI